MQAFIAGFSLGLSLILAIGSQNAFVLKQGLKKQYVFTVALMCGLSDAILISIGVYGINYIVELLPSFSIFAKYFGVIFLVVYGAKSFISAFKNSDALKEEQSKQVSWTKTILTCLAFTWLNPHVYLDTVVLIGSISTGYAEQRALFTFGAVLASFVFFFSLAYGARLLAPLLSTTKCWRILDCLIGIIMFVIAWNLFGMKV